MHLSNVSTAHSSVKAALMASTISLSVMLCPPFVLTVQRYEKYQYDPRNFLKIFLENFSFFFSKNFLEEVHGIDQVGSQWDPSFRDSFRDIVSRNRSIQQKETRPR